MEVVVVAVRRGRAGHFRRVVGEVVRALEAMPEAEGGRWLDFLSFVFALVYHYRATPERPVLVEAIWTSVSTDTRRKELRRMHRSIADDLRAERKLEGKAEGALANARATLLRMIALRFGPVPDRIRDIVERTADQDTLTRWLDRFATAESLDEVGIE